MLGFIGNFLLINVNDCCVKIVFIIIIIMMVEQFWGV